MRDHLDNRRQTEDVFGHASVTWVVFGFVAVVCAALIWLQTSHIMTQRAEILAAAHRDTSNLSSSLIQHAELTFRTADALLIAVVERMEQGADTAPEFVERQKSWFRREIQNSPQFVSFKITDSDGSTIVSSADEDAPLNYSDRDYFVYHQTRTSSDLYIGTTVKSRRGAGWIIPVSRRYNRVDGSFGGIVSATIDPDYFQKLYEGLQLGKDGAILLASTSGRILVRQPFVEANVGRDFSNGVIFQLLKQSPVGSTELASAMDGVRRINSYAQGTTYPVVVAVAQNIFELLAPWRRNALRQLGITSLIIAFIGIMGLVVWRMTRSLAASARRVHDSNVQFDATLAHMPNGVTMFDAEGKLVLWNDRCIEMYGFPPGFIRRGISLEEITTYRSQAGHFEMDPDAYVRRFRKELTDYGSHTSRSQLADGRTVSITSSAIEGGGWVSIHEDITRRLIDEQAVLDQTAQMVEANLRFDAALNNMTHGLALFDEDSRLVMWNSKFREMYDLPAELLVRGIHISELVAHNRAQGPASDELTVDERVEQIQNLVHQIVSVPDGRTFSIKRTPIATGGWVAVHEDVTEQRRAEARISHLARHDVLTGLANRAEFNARLDEACKRFRRNGGAVTVMMIDLDKFKQVNDTLGHPAGDALLVEVARRLNASVRETDILARLGGDEFAIIQDGGPNPREGAIALSLRILSAVTDPFDLDGHQASIGASIGIAMMPDHGSDPEALLKKADLALYDVKAKGRNDFCIFEPELQEIANTQQSAESELRDAIANEEFELHYQPMVDARTLVPCGAEALVRWRHPTRGLIDPDEFIPLAESSGLIMPLGEWLLQKACADATAWPAHIRLAINISAVQFKKANLFEVILCTLVETGLPPERLELEITETALLENREAHLATIRQLKNLGVVMALDDFGTGYSSVNYLTVFPFDKIKIDKSFTQGVLDRQDCRAIVASTLVLAQGLGTMTIAEGVETEAQLDYLRAAGVDQVQGYLLGRPVPLAQLDLRGEPVNAQMVA